jgi:urea carboxylase
MHKRRSGVGVSGRRTRVRTGAPVRVALDGAPVPQWQSITVPPGGVLDVEMLTGPGMRWYVLMAGGLQEPEYLGSTATFTLGAFGGHGGRPLREGDVLTAGLDPGPLNGRPARAAIDEQPSIGHRWEIAVTEGPHAAPELFTAPISTRWLAPTRPCTSIPIAPVCGWSARSRNGRATTAVKRGCIRRTFTTTLTASALWTSPGDTPILLGPDGPSLGGFVCPVTVVGGDRWKLGQIAPGDAVRFVPVRADRPPSLRTIDIPLRARVHVLYEHLLAQGIPGVIELTPASALCRCSSILRC